MRTALSLNCLLLVGCAQLTVPTSEDTDTAGQKAPSPKPAASAAAAPEDKPARVREEREERVEASHILVSYKGSQRAKEDITRTKEQAKARAEEVQAKAAKGDDFAKLAETHSDGPSAPKGGSLGKFSKRMMVKPFSDAAFALKVGQVSAVVETPFGFHVIKRTE
jgi:parvulin-like peptidyl-prolyl isomerase